MPPLLGNSHVSNQDFLSMLSRTAVFQHGKTQSSSSRPLEEVIGVVLHLASRKPVDKALALLRWSFISFPGQEICLLYVHRPSTVIPTLLGELPATGANPETVAAHRDQERNEALNLLSSCLTICSRLRITASAVATEAEEVQKGMLNLLKQHGIRKVVVGACTEFIVGKKSSCRDCHAARYAPSFCEMWFVNKGKLIWKRRAASLCSQLAEIKSEVHQTRDESYLKCLEKKQLEAEVLKEFNKVKALELAHSLEVKLRKDVEDALKVTVEEHEKLLEDREQTNQQLRKTLLDMALLDSRVRKANHRCEEVSGELKLIQASITALRKEKQKLLQQKIEATKWIRRNSVGLVSEVCELPEFLLSDVEAATCNFLECFRIGKGGNGVVYKGEMLDRTVAIKKLLHYNMQTEFNEVVQILHKLHHPRLVELLGICPEACLLVYEYLPGSSLHNYIYSNKLNSLGWKARVQIVADIASGLLFLHSFRPQILVHGNLKPQNLLLDSNGRCKIGDYADHMLTSGNMIRCPSFSRCADSTGASNSLYTDPESHRTRKFCQKSDIYSFGLIILQLVTGNTQRGLVSEVCWAVSNDRVENILDSSVGEWPVYIARRLLEMGLQFCERNSQNRPELAPSLVKELERMPALVDQIVPSFFCCPIRHELMHEPQLAADGFTYEREAIRQWLGNGHETSPMTNLKLGHLNLTPNHSLRLAIQDWMTNL